MNINHINGGKEAVDTVIWEGIRMKEVLRAHTVKGYVETIARNPDGTLIIVAGMVQTMMYYGRVEAVLKAGWEYEEGECRFVNRGKSNAV